MQPQRIAAEANEIVRAGRAPVRAAAEGDQHANSPALALQQSLAHQLNEPEVERWPLAARAAVMLVASAALWAGVIFVGQQVLEAL